MKLQKRVSKNLMVASLMVGLLFLAVGLFIHWGALPAFAKSPQSSSLQLTKIRPSQTQAGVGFQVQKNGSSAISVMGEQITKTTVIVWQKTQLKTNHSKTDPKLASALVPKTLYAKPGKYEIYLYDTKTKKESNKLIFTVNEKTAAKLQLSKMGPTKTKANQMFRVQSNGQSAIWVKGAGITRDTKIMWEKTQLRTLFVDSNTLTAFVPKSLISKAGKYAIYLLDTKTKAKSESLTFTVE